MQIKFEIRWSLGPEPGSDMDPFLFRLLETIRREGALNQAVRLLGCSYRYAWGLIKRWEKEFGAPLVNLERGRGRGAQLTELGEKLLWTNHKLQQETAPQLESIAGEVNETLAEYTRRDRRLRLHIHASHDLAVQQLESLLNTGAGLETELQTHGSLESLHALSSGRCHIAGFHFPLGPLGEALIPRYRRWLDERRHTLLLLARREQGLITREGNPKRVHDLQDLTRRSVRFVNRQKESGTRTVFDRLLEESGIEPARITGYNNEEFTHFAVAAMVASSAADAGFGLKAAAARFGLHFIPVLSERYLIAFDNDLGPDLTSAVKHCLKGRAFRDAMAGVEGYDTSKAGTVIPMRKLAA